jgi:hypothetical protein
MAVLPIVPERICREFMTGTPLAWRMEKMLANRDMAAFTNRGPSRGTRSRKASLTNFPCSVLK